MVMFYIGKWIRFIFQTCYYGCIGSKFQRAYLLIPVTIEYLSLYLFCGGQSGTLHYPLKRNH